MQAPTLPDTSTDQSVPASARPRRRSLTLLVGGAAVVLAAAIGSSVALATRSTPTAQPTAIAPAATTPSAPAAPAQQHPATAGKAASPADTTARPSGGRASQPVLPDGRTEAYIRSIDTAHGRITVDVVQVFHGDAAREAAVQDGKSRDSAQYLDVYVRNQNPRLRTLPLASGLRVDLLGGCEDSASHQLSKLAEDARTGSYYYTLTVRDGAVQRIEEHLAINAC